LLYYWGENGRHVDDVEVATQPAHVPTPFAVEVAPVEVQDATKTTWVPKNRAIKGDELDVPVHPFLPCLGNEVLIAPEEQKHDRVEADVPQGHQSFQPLFAFNRQLASLERRHQANLVHIDLGQPE